jgi:phosphohistidine phosphatase
LSGQGLAEVRRLAGLLGRAGVRVERVFHSGKTRAEQTAVLLGAALLPGGQPLALEGLAPNDPVEPLAAAIAGWSADTLAVGHLPSLGRLASLLLVGDPRRPLLAFRPGGLACLERDQSGGWSLCWMLGPEPLGPAGEP